MDKCKYPNILKAFETYGTTRKEAAEKLGITYRGLAMKLSGKHDFKAGEVRTLAELWGVSTDYLLGNG